MRRSVIVGVYGVFVFLGTMFAMHVSATESHLSLGGKEYSATIAESDAAHEKGLSGRSSLGKDQAMLFAFDAPAQRCFWMKDMEFSIDIVWASANKRITHFERDVSPATYPHAFCPEAPTQYVVETPAGSTKDARMGDSIHIQR